MKFVATFIHSKKLNKMDPRALLCPVFSLSTSSERCPIEKLMAVNSISSKIVINQLPVSDAWWQYESDKCFETFLK
jgi:hypothetical protein